MVSGGKLALKKGKCSPSSLEQIWAHQNAASDGNPNAHVGLGVVAQG